MNSKYFDMKLVNSECCDCIEVEEIIINISDYLDRVNDDNYLELNEEYDNEILDFWGGYMLFLKEEYYNIMNKYNIFNIIDGK